MPVPPRDGHRLQPCRMRLARGHGSHRQSRQQPGLHERRRRPQTESGLLSAPPTFDSHTHAGGIQSSRMNYFYGEFNGQAFPTPDQLFGLDQMMEFILQYGEQALKAIEQMLKDPKNQEQSDLLEQLLKEGMLDKDGKGKVRLTPKAIGRMQRKALMEVFSNLREGTREG